MVKEGEDSLKLLNDQAAKREAQKKHKKKFSRKKEA